MLEKCILAFAFARAFFMNGYGLMNGSGLKSGVNKIVLIVNFVNNPTIFF
jgi:hypothetical protein